MTTYRGALGVVAVASSKGAVVLWGSAVAIYPSIEEARMTVGALEQVQLSQDEADYISRRIGEAEERMHVIMWG